MKKINSRKSIINSLILSSVVFLVGSLTYLFGRGVIVKESLEAVCKIKVSPITVYFCANWTTNQQARVNSKFTNVESTATITAKTSNNKIAKATLKTNSTQDSVSTTSVLISPSSKTIDINERLMLTATITPENVTDKSIEWESSNTSVAEVSSNGVVTGKKAGTAIITGRSTNGKTGTARITVTSNVSPTDIVDIETITLLPASKTINAGGKLSLLALITPSNATDKTLVWASSDSSIATVNSSGVVTGKSSGTVTITVTTINGKEATSTITVNSSSTTPSRPETISVTGIDITPTSATLEIGEIISLVSMITPNNATNKSITWTSSDPSIAIVNSSGVVTAKSAGKVEITATTVDGKKTATSYIIVNKKVEIIVDDPKKPEEPSILEPTTYEPGESELNVNSTILIIGLIALGIFIIGAVVYFIVKSKKANSV